MREVHASFHVKQGDADAARDLLSNAGFHVNQRDNDPNSEQDETWIEARRVVPDGSADRQREVREITKEVLRLGGIEARVAGGGVSANDYHPSRRWMEVVDTETLKPLGLKVSAATDDEIDYQLDQAAQSLGLPRARLDVKAPEDWEPGPPP